MNWHLDGPGPYGRSPGESLGDSDLCRTLRREGAVLTAALQLGIALAAGEAAVANGKACTQACGGMGFTWEVDAHLFLKRAWYLAWYLDTTFGTPDTHAEALAGFL